MSQKNYWATGFALVLAAALCVTALAGQLLGGVSCVFVLLLLRRDGRLEGWRQAAMPLLAGLAFAMGGLAVIGLARTVLETCVGPPL